MGEKQSQKKDGADKTKDGADKKADGNPTAVVLKVDMHCSGCISKIIKCARAMEGVEAVKVEAEANKLTAVGKVDPSLLKDKLEQRTKKKVELLSPLPKKDKEKKGDNNNDKANPNANANKGGGSKKTDKNKKSEEKPENKPDDKKPKEKERPVTTAVLKVSLHCQGCVDKIQRLVTRTRGVHEVSLDKQKELVTVKGTMDAKALAETLKEKMKKPVEIVPPKKDKEGGGGEEKKEGGNNGNGKKGKKGGNGGGGDGEGQQCGGAKVEGNRMEYTGPALAPGNGNPYVYWYPAGYMEHLHAPQMFSDENPNACSVM